MKLIGLIGGMSWESSAIYYRLMNERVRDRLGGHHSARLLLHSVDFHAIKEMQHEGDWVGTARLLGQAARSLKAGGADFLVIATNTMHKVAREIEAESGLEVIHIADPTGEALAADGVSRVALLGTRFTMEQDFYRRRLEERFGLEVLVPEAGEREEIHRIIYDELCLGIVRRESAETYRDIIAAMRDRGAEAVILGCTEITMIVDEHVSPMPAYDTTRLHAEAAVDRAIG